LFAAAAAKATKDLASGIGGFRVRFSFNRTSAMFAKDGIAGLLGEMTDT
jgi:hypothetical protein